MQERLTLDPVFLTRPSYLIFKVTNRSESKASKKKKEEIENGTGKREIELEAGGYKVICHAKRKGEKKKKKNAAAAEELKGKLVLLMLDMARESLNKWSIYVQCISLDSPSFGHILLR